MGVFGAGTGHISIVPPDRCSLSCPAPAAANVKTARKLVAHNSKASALPIPPR